MRPWLIYTLKALRRIYSYTSVTNPKHKPTCELDPDIASQIIYDKLTATQPCMIARFGSTELGVMVNYLGVEEKRRNIAKYITGKSAQWWWQDSLIAQMQHTAGFFPADKETIGRFCKLMLTDMKEVDILGSWLTNENQLNDQLNCKKVHLRLLEPFWANAPWTRALKGKKVLVVHPFSEEIKLQYKQRAFLFNNPDILPDFELTTIQAIQSIDGDCDNFKTWFDAIEFMKSEIDKVDYDFCLIGCGAYGFPIAAHVKRTGKKAIHLGGVLQLLFGIRGKRWEQPGYGVKEWGIPDGLYTSLINNYWIRPGENSKPKNAELVEGGCYW